MKKFKLTVFYDGDIYNAYSLCETITFDFFTNLFTSLCSANNLDENKVEILWFDFDFVDDFIDVNNELLESDIGGE